MNGAMPLQRRQKQTIDLRSLPLSSDYPLVDRCPLSIVVAVVITLRWPDSEPQWKVHENDSGDGYLVASHWKPGVCIDARDLERIRATNPALVRRISFFASADQLNLVVEVRKLSRWSAVTCTLEATQVALVKPPTGTGLGADADAAVTSTVCAILASLRRPAAVPEEVKTHDDGANGQSIVASRWAAGVELDIEHLDVVRSAIDPAMLRRIYIVAMAATDEAAPKLSVVVEVRKPSLWTASEPVSVLCLCDVTVRRSHEFLAATADDDEDDTTRTLKRPRSSSPDD